MIKTVSIIPGNACILPIDNIETIIEKDVWLKISRSQKKDTRFNYVVVGEVNEDTKCIVCTKTGYAYPSTFRQTVLKGRIDKADSLDSEE